MAIIEMNPNLGIAERFGTGLGAGLGGGLQELANMKLEALKSRHASQAESSKNRKMAPMMATVLGVSPDEAFSILQAPPDVRKGIINNLAMRGSEDRINQLLGNAGPQETQMAGPQPATGGFSEALGGGQGAPQYQQQPQQPMGNIESIIAQLNNQQFNKLSPEQQKMVAEQLLQQMEQQPSQQVSQQQAPQQQRQKGLLAKPLSANEILGVERIKQGNRKFEQSERQFEQTHGFKREVFETNKEEQIRKDAEPFIKEQFDKLAALKEKKSIFGAMRETIQKGELPNPVLYNALETIGLNWPAFFSEDVGTIEKLRSNLMSQVGKLGLGRITNTEWKTLEKGIINLGQTQKGQEILLDMMDALTDAEMAVPLAMQDILDANGGKPVANLRILAEKKAASTVDKFFNEVKKATHYIGKNSLGKTYTTNADIAKAGYKAGDEFKDTKSGKIGVWDGKKMVLKSEYKEA